MRPFSPSRVYLALYAAVCAFGVGVVFYPTISSGFQQMQVEPGDTLLNQYFLEHFFRWVSDGDYIGGLWSPPMMYPYSGALAFSDNLFAVGPYYWALRIFAEPDVAYQLWMPLMFVFNFAAFCHLGRRLGVHPLLSAAAAFIFAFGMHRIAQLGHQQLLPQFYTPVALGYFVEFARAPGVKALSLALLFTYLQVMAAVYLGWFLLLSLAFFLPLLVLLNKGADSKLLGMMRSMPQFWAVIAVWIAAMFASLMPYLRAQEVVGPRSLAEVDTMLPRLTSWFLSFPGSIYASLIPEPGLPMVHEHWMFAGFGVWVMIVAGVWAVARGRVDQSIRAPAYAAGLTFAAIVLISLRFPDGFSLWPIVYEWVPGAGAIRGVSRIGLIAYPYALLFGALSLQSLLGMSIRPTVARTAAAATLLIFSMGEQVVTGLPHFGKREFLDDVADIEPLMADGCDFAYLTHPSTSRDLVQLKAMWASLGTNVPVANGYSGGYPQNYPFPAQNVDEVVAWLKRIKPDINGELCIILPAEIGYASKYRAGGRSPLGKWQSFYVSAP